MAEPERILLTGATGYVGAATIRAFMALGKIDKVTAMVRDANRAKEALELGAKAVLVVPDITELHARPELGHFDCVLNTVNIGAGFTYAKESKVAEDMVAAMRKRGGGTYVQLTGTGCVGGTHGKDGAFPGEYTDWSELKPLDTPGFYSPSKRHAAEKTTVLADDGVGGGALRTAVIRPSGIYGGDGRTDISIRPYFRDAERDGAARVAGSGNAFLPLVHVEDVGDLCARVALTPTARGIFHAAEASAESKETSLSMAEIARLCSEAAGTGGAITVRGARRPATAPTAAPKTERVGQTLSCQNALSIGWRPRVFDPKVEWADYLKAKETWAQRNGGAESSLEERRKPNKAPRSKL